MADVKARTGDCTVDCGTVLVVDDEPEVAGMYAAILEDSHTVRTATSGEAALRKFTSDVDVVLLDRRMPDTSGDELLDVVRSEGYKYQVAMVTAVKPDDAVTDLSFDAYVVKPVRSRDLREVVDELLRRAEYGPKVRELLRVASKRRALETRADSGAPSDDEHRGLLRRQAHLERESQRCHEELLDRIESPTLFRDVVEEARRR